MKNCWNVEILLEENKKKWAVANELSLEIEYIHQWIESRLVFLDDYFNQL